MKFYYEDVLKRHFFYDIKRPKKEETIPTVLTKEEIKRLIEVTNNPKHKLLIKFLYASGLRVNETVKVRINDLDLEEGLVFVKGGKDRKSILSKNLVEELNEYLNTRKDNNPFLFPGAREGKHLSVRSAQKIIEKSARIVGIKKNVTCHSLRHSFATHLLEKGVDIRFIQKLIGHKRLTTTQVYTKISTQQLKKITSPLDDL